MHSQASNWELIFDYPVCTSSCEQCIQTITQWIDNGSKARYVACANAHSLQVAEKDLLFKQVLQQADLLIPDGMGLVLASFMQGGVLRKRITGSDVFDRLSWVLNQRAGAKVFFLGSSENTLALIRNRMAIDFPQVEIAGTYSPPFKEEFSPEESRAMVEAVNRAAPHVLWVGMTAPKQEKWIYANLERLQVPFIAPIGAVFDFFAGTKKRSSPVMGKIGLEWLHRFIMEPRRLLQRNLKSHTTFFFKVLFGRFHKPSNSG